MLVRGIAVTFAKDLRLLARDRAGLVFLSIAPVVVILVAGLSLAGFYGASPRGDAAYVRPLADEDGGEIGAAIRNRLEGEGTVRVRPVATEREARELVRRREAGLALVIPAGTSAAVASGGRAGLVLLTDPVKVMEVAALRALVQELRHEIEARARQRAAERLEAERQAALAARVDLEHAAARAREEMERFRSRLERLRAELRRRAEETRAGVDAALEREAAIRRRAGEAIARLRAFLDALSERRKAFGRWLGELRERAGSRADEIPSPPTLPEVPPALEELAAGGPAELLGTDVPGAARRGRALPPGELPPIPELPDVPALRLPEPGTGPLPGPVELRETSVTGAPVRLNAFDQNVPGFSVTFLLLGMLLGVSLGLLDERDWGTLERIRATPTPLAAALVGKLLARFTVGVVQMVGLFAVGRLAFDVSLGPEPWALLLPIAGIVFAATAFGLVAAGLARSREAVLPVGSIVIVTMAAVGGCWWPIDVEPPWMRRLALAFPTTWAMAAFNDLMIRRQGLEAALAPTAALLAHGGLYLAAGLALFRRRENR